MRFASALTSRPDGDSATADLLDQIGTTIDPAAANFALVFCSAHYEDELQQIINGLTQALPAASVIGCTAEGTIGCDREEQRSCSISLLVGEMPGVDVRPFQISQEQLDQSEGADDWKPLLQIDDQTNPFVVVFGDPFTFHIQNFLEKTNQALPGMPIVGGLASGADRPGQNRLILDAGLYDEGLVGLTLSGNIFARTVVSQGCKPIGTPFVVTKCERNIVQELGRKPALNRLREVVEELDQKDLILAQQSLFMGRAINEYQAKFRRGDFLIHNILGYDQKGGAIAIAAMPRVGTTVQFHVRDAGSADEDLRDMLADISPSCQEHPPAGAMLISCNGRGIRMWPQQDAHDVTVLHEACGQLPVAGYFAAGEIGPVVDRNFIHGFTAIVVLLSPKHS